MQKVGVYRNERWLIRNIDLTLNKGEIVTIIGPNGAGKSTTAKVALNILSPNEGKVTRAQKLIVGYVPQKLSIDWTLPLTVERLMHLTSAPKKGEIQQALTRTGIPHLQNAPVQNLSGGEFQRALLARAILRRPNILVLDEPVQGVDTAGEAALYQLINELKSELDCGVLLISHDLHVVMAQTDRVVCLNGHVCCQGTPATISNTKEFQELFGKTAAPTWALYQHQHNHTHTLDGTIKQHTHDTTDNDCCQHHYEDK
ncbi:zinc ABC transporter ATP-binding protein ZnuC [Polycladidibacter stylochi]|uniref:zinc ABC transporter ATP-binding protein ZnuC n=1 Tax=Polycladidibacter stylochi TaxID=1807766 RepID=UPI0012E39E4F|nr:zinc ABC transporter ATP-binding protein ZnuC [Pseudovibrio stylochi]